MNALFDERPPNEKMVLLLLGASLLIVGLAICLFRKQRRQDGQHVSRFSHLPAIMIALGCLLLGGGLALWAADFNGMKQLNLAVTSVFVLLLPLFLLPFVGIQRPFWTNVAYVFWIVGSVAIISYLVLSVSYPTGIPIEASDPLWISRAGNGLVSLLVASLAGLYGYLILALTFGFDTARTADPRQYEELKTRLKYLRTVLPDQCSQVNGTAFEQSSCDVVREQTNSVENALNDDSVDTSEKWITGTGYVNQWVALHDAEASLMKFQPVAQVIAEAKIDRNRLPDNLNHEGTTKTIDEAITALSNTSTGKEEERKHRAYLASVRRQINDVRDEARYGLVATKQRVLVAGAVTAIVLSIFMAIVLVTQPTWKQVFAAAVFFLAASLVGLFRELYASGNELSSSEGDFQLARARQINIPLLSGIAGIAGVIITAFFIFVADGSALTPGELTPTPTPTATTTATPVGTPAATPTRTTEETAALVVAQQTQIAAFEAEERAASQRDDPPTFDQIFNLETNRIGIVIAAIFGLTPSLLMSRLNANQYAETLRKSSGIQKH